MPQKLGRSPGDGRLHVGQDAFRPDELVAAAGGGGLAPGQIGGRLGSGPQTGADQAVQVLHLLHRLVGAASTELLDPGPEPGDGLFRGIAAFGRDLLPFPGRLLRFDVRGHGLARGRRRLAAPGERVGGPPGVRAQVGRVAGQERLGRLVGGGQSLQGEGHGFHVVERPCRLGDQVVIDRAEAVGEGVRQLHRVEVLRELRSPQRENQREQLLVPLRAEAEQSVVHGRAVLGGRPEQGGLADLLGELFAGHRPVVVGDEGEVLTNPAVGNEMPADGGVAVSLRVQTDPYRDRLAGSGVPELQPCVAHRVLAPAVQQVGLHRAVFGRERVQPLGVDPAVEHEREEHLERLGLAGSVRAAQHEPAAREAELLVAVVPHVDDPGTGGFESGHGFAGSFSWAVTLR
jgi:hypothetical protein